MVTKYILPIILVLSCTLGKVIVHGPSDLAGQYRGYLMLPNNDFAYESNLSPITGTAATSLNILDATGNILLAPRCSAFLVQDLMRYQSKYLPKVILMQTPSFDNNHEAGFSEYSLETYNMKDLALLETPILIMETTEFNKLFNYLGFNGSADLTVTFDPNPWRVVISSPAWWILSVSLLAFMVICIIFIAIRFADFVKQKGFQLTIAQVVLLLLLLGTTRNFVAWVVDGGKSFRNTSNFTQVAVSEIPTGMATLSSLLTIFFLHEIATLSSIRVTTFINKLKIPAIIAAIILMFLQFWVFMSRSIVTVYASWLDLLSAIYDFIVSLIVIIYFCYVASVFYAKLKSRGADDASKRRIRKSVIDLSCVILALLLRLVVYVIVIAGYFQYSNYFFGANGFRYFLWSEHLTIQILMFCLANLFKVPTEQRKIGTSSATRDSAN